MSKIACNSNPQHISVFKQINEIAKLHNNTFKVILQLLQHLENNQKLQDWSTEGLPQRSKLTQFSNVYCLSPQCFAIPLLLSASNECTSPKHEIRIAPNRV
jgi:hypothetical protein